jgi:hypothetical protein
VTTTPDFVRLAQHPSGGKLVSSIRLDVEGTRNPEQYYRPDPLIRFYTLDQTHDSNSGQSR